MDKGVNPYFPLLSTIEKYSGELKDVPLVANLYNMIKAL